MLSFSIIYTIFSNAVSLRQDKSILFSRGTILVFIYSSFIGLDSLYISNLDRGIGLYGGLFHATSITQTFQIFILLITIIILQLTAFFPRHLYFPNINRVKKEEFTIRNLELTKVDNMVLNNTPEILDIHSRTVEIISTDNNILKITNERGEQFKIIEYPLIILFITTGALLLISSGDLVSIFLSIELQSYGLYILSTIYRDSELATSGGLTYFLLGGLSSCFILLGTSLLYGNSGTTNLDGLYVITSISEISENNSNYVLEWYKSDYINVSLLILSVGFLFKVSAAPFHFWSPDVYDAIPTIVTTFVAIIAKISIFIFFLELVHYTSNFLITPQFNWTTGLLVSSLLSLLIGSIVGLSQFRIKRLLAYSTISHVGFILLALSINSIESIQAFIFYLVQYTISNLNVFIILIALSFSSFYYITDNKEIKGLKDINNSPIQILVQIKGFFYINPILALSLAITIFSFIGMPPLIGFFGKLLVLNAALSNGYIFITLIAILTSVISALYYLNIIKIVFFDKPEYYLNPKIDGLRANIISITNSSLSSNIKGFWNEVKEHKSKRKIDTNNIVLANYLTMSISVLTLIVSLFMFMPQELTNMANILALIIFNP